MAEGATMTVSLHLERSPLSVRVARTALMRLLGDGPSISFVRDAILLTSELVSNALLHTGGSCRLHAAYRTQPDHLRVEVSDDSASPAVMPEAPPSPSRGGGLGLRLVNEVASAWGNEVHADGGKTVWFEMHGSR